MTTFTMQELNNINETPTAEEEEAMQELFKQMGKDLTQPAPTLQQVVENMAIPTEGTNVPLDVPTIINTICAQLQLLSTVISKPQGNSLNAEDQSLQQCVALTLQQADWFKEMVGACIDEDMVQDAVKDSVETEVEYYFNHSFSPEDHFDFGDAVSDAVDDRLDDIVADKIDDVVQEKFDEFIENATFKLER